MDLIIFKELFTEIGVFRKLLGLVDEREYQASSGGKVLPLARALGRPAFCRNLK